MGRRQNEILKEFIEIYKSEKCLWQIKSPEYRDRNKRSAAYEKLVQKLRQIEPDANKDVVVRKINNLRSCVRKERKKCQASRKSASSPDDLYKPMLWYYDLFEFLQQDSSSNLEEEGTDSEETNDRMLDDSNDKDSNIENSACEPTAFLEIGFSDVNESSPQSQKRKDSIYSPEPPKKKICQPNQEVAIKSVKPFNECVSQRDEFSVYGEHIANKLRYSCRSRLEIAMAQRQIDDACYKLVVGEFSQFPQSTDQTSSDNQLTF